MQLAEEWILRSCNILENPYSSQAYISAIEEAEQFVWAGSEMDLVSIINFHVISGFLLILAVPTTQDALHLFHR